MSFPSFSNFGFQKKKTFPMVLSAVSNGNFSSYEIQTALGGGTNFTTIFGSSSASTTLNTTLLPAWVVTIPSGNIYVIISTGNSVWYPSDRILPAGAENSNVVIFQFNQKVANTTGTISQNVNLAVGMRTLSFYASSRVGTAPNVTFSVSLGGTTLASSILPTNTDFTLCTYTYQATTNGTYQLVITLTNRVSGDNTINFANVNIT